MGERLAPNQEPLVRNEILPCGTPVWIISPSDKRRKEYVEIFSQIGKINISLFSNPLAAKQRLAHRTTEKNNPCFIVIGAENPLSVIANFKEYLNQLKKRKNSPTFAVIFVSSEEELLEANNHSYPHVTVSLGPDEDAKEKMEAAVIALTEFLPPSRPPNQRKKP